LQIRKCFSYTTYFAVDSQRYGRGGIFEGNLRGPIEEIAPKLKAKITEELGMDVVLFFLIDEYTGRQVSETEGFLLSCVLCSIAI
jgi:hypothetical protein